MGHNQWTWQHPSGISFLVVTICTQCACESIIFCWCNFIKLQVPQLSQSHNTEDYRCTAVGASARTGNLSRPDAGRSSSSANCPFLKKPSIHNSLWRKKPRIKCFKRNASSLRKRKKNKHDKGDVQARRAHKLMSGHNTPL